MGGRFGCENSNFPGTHRPPSLVRTANAGADWKSEHTEKTHNYIRCGLLISTTAVRIPCLAAAAAGGMG